MKTTPNKIKIETVTVNEFAEAAGLTARRIRQLSIEEKRIPPIKKGRIELLAGLKSLIAFYQRTPEAMQAERLALVRTTRETKQLELSTAQGNLIRRDVATNTGRAVVLKLRDFFRAENEVGATASRKEKLEQLGATPEIVATFYEWDLKEAANRDDRVAERCQKEAKNDPNKTDENKN